MALQTTISADIKAVQTKALDLGTASFPINLPAAKTTLSDGTGDGQASKIFSDQRTIAASSSENLDLAGGLTDAYGTTITFATIKAIYVKAADTNTNDVVVGAAASNGFVGPFAADDNSVTVKPGGALLIFAPKSGWAVTASTADILKIANSSSGTGVVYDVVLVGT